MTSADIIARARKAAGMPEEGEDPPPKLFEDELLDDMQDMLLILEKRVKEGPGSVSVLETEQFYAITTNILKEMKDKESERISGVGSTEPSPTTGEVAEIPKSQTDKPGVSFASEDSALPLGNVSTDEVVDTSNDEGPEYKGGMGLAKGTANTYVIDGMDAMSPDEYQKALQKSIIDRQSNRKTSAAYGNRATWDYLNNLTGETGVLNEDA